MAHIRVLHDKSRISHILRISCFWGIGLFYVNTAFRPGGEQSCRNGFPFCRRAMFMSLWIHATLLYEKKAGRADFLHEKADADREGAWSLFTQWPAPDYVLIESGYDHPPHCLLLTNGYLTQSVHLLEGIPLLHRTLLAKCLYAAPEHAAEIWYS